MQWFLFSHKESLTWSSIEGGLKAKGFLSYYIEGTRVVSLRGKFKME